MVFEFKNGDYPKYDCIQCGNRYCLNCRSKYHKNQTCEEYSISIDPEKTEKAFQKFVNGNKFKMCTCGFWVEKTSGCDHMNCRCGRKFCYLTGKDL